MIFQILDDRKECFGIYRNGEFIYDRVPRDSTGTWNWNIRLSEYPLDYASMYVGGKSLNEVCPDSLRARLDKREAKIKAFIKY